MAESSDTPACIPYLGVVELGGSILGDVYPRLTFSSRSTFYLPLWHLPFFLFRPACLGLPASGVYELC